MQMQNSVAKKPSQQNSMSKFEMVLWKHLSLSSHLNHVSFQGMTKDGRVKGKEETHLLGSLYMLLTKEDPWFLLTMLVSLLKAFCTQEEEAH